MTFQDMHATYQIAQIQTHLPAAARALVHQLAPPYIVSAHQLAGSV